MRNDPLPHQLTLGAFRRVTAEAPDGAVVCVTVPATARHDDLVTLHNVEVRYEGGPVVRLDLASPVVNKAEPVGLATGRNLVARAVLAVEAKGFTVERDDHEESEVWRAVGYGIEVLGGGPIELLGLVNLLETRGQQSQAIDEQIDEVMRRFDLG